MIPKSQLFFGSGLLILLIFSFGIFGLYKARDFLLGPKIVIESPSNGQTVSSSYLEIKGAAKNISLLYLNGRQIFTDQEGNFKENLLLARGYNIIEVSAKDKFNREARIKREVVLK
jgi:hypothetical protein